MPELPGLRRVGHKGADLIVPGNTLASFDAAVEAGVDMIEFDVLPHEGRLVLAHDLRQDLSSAPSLEEGLEHLAGLDIDLDVDLKWHGYEEDVVRALQTYGLVGRALVSTMFMRSLVRVRELEPALKLGWSVPRIHKDRSGNPFLMIPAAGVVLYLRRRIPPAAARHLAAGRIDAVMVHWRLYSEALQRVVDAAEAELYVWTVDEAPRIRELERRGVTGIITNDPRLFLAGPQP